MENNFDSSKETLLHIKRVNELLIGSAKELLDRAVVHDSSKLEDPEKKEFDRLTPKLKVLEFGSQAYKDSLTELGVALDHHYQNNSHHPQHYENGIDGMNLFDVLEMLLDWKAAGERHTTGDIYKSIEINKERFGMSDQLTQIFINTANYLNW